MYYIIETEEQLQKFSNYEFTNSFVDIITMNDNSHPALSNICLIYIKPFRSRMGFILSIDHSEAFSLPKDKVMAFIDSKLENIYAVDAKRLNYFLNRNSIYCAKTAKYLATGEILEESSYNTQAHQFFYRKYEYKDDINKIIPISKHFEKYENIIAGFNFNIEWAKSKYYKLYGNLMPKIFYEIENQGIKIDNAKFSKHYSLKNDLMSIKSDKIYTNYNFFTATGRPSNAFNGINFGAIKKEDGSRKAFVTSKTTLIEYDYHAYHIKILANIIGYNFKEDDIHSHLGKQYFDKDTLNEEEYTQSKQLTFKLLYTDSMLDEMNDISFFKIVKGFKDDLWKSYKQKGYIESMISKRPIKGITSKTQVLPYLLQNYETERNILVLNQLLKFLRDKHTKLILYNYDSFLLDFDKKDGRSILTDVQAILEQDGYIVSCKFGSNYQEMNTLC